MTNNWKGYCEGCSLKCSASDCECRCHTPTTVVNIRKEKCDIYIGRPSKWGNPFALGTENSRKEVIEKYRQWIVTQPKLLNEVAKLKGLKLGCYCKPLFCHGDVLIELAEEYYEIPSKD